MLLSTLFNTTQSILKELHLFAECSSNPHGQVLPLWDAEFGYILYQHVPMVYDMCRNNKIKRINICKGMYPFYYFIDKRMIKEQKCLFDTSINLNIQHKVLKYKGVMPNYAPYIRKTSPYFYVYNKHNHEWGAAPVNTLLHPDLNIIFDELCFPAIYHRAKNNRTLGTKDDIKLYGDFELAKNRNILTTKDILKENHDHEMMNALQIVLAKNAYSVIGVQGGMAVMSSLIGAKLLVLCKKGSECQKDYHFYPQTHNSTIIITKNTDEIQRVIKHICGKPSYFHASR
jgi:hypothetical protein